MKENAYTALSRKKGPQVEVVGYLRIINSLFFGNKMNTSEGIVFVSDGEAVISNTTFLANANKNAGAAGIWLAGPVGEVIDSQILDDDVQHKFFNDQTYLTNSVFKKNRLSFRALIGAGKDGGDVTLTNVTIYGVSYNDVGQVGQPSHFWLLGGNLYMYNTVIADEDGSPAHDVPLVQVAVGSTVAEIVNSHVSDGSLSGTSTGESGLERPITIPTSFKPASGSTLIDGGDALFAVDPRTCAGVPEICDPLTHDVLGGDRIHGPAVDIGAVEVQEGFAINDLYTTPEGTNLFVDPPGVASNDTFVTLVNIVFFTEGSGECGTPSPICKRTLHGDLISTPEGPGPRNGGFIYKPDPGFTGSDGFQYTLLTFSGLSNIATVVIEVTAKDGAPDCSNAYPSIDQIWSPHHEFVPVNILGVTDPDGDPITITIDKIFQDEPVDSHGDGRSVPDGEGVGTDTAWVRAERAGSKRVPGNGRMYHISFHADDGKGAACSGTVRVGVPHNKGKHSILVDDGPNYDSTALAP